MAPRRSVLEQEEKEELAVCSFLLRILGGEDGGGVRRRAKLSWRRKRDREKGGKEGITASCQRESKSGEQKSFTPVQQRWGRESQLLIQGACWDGGGGRGVGGGQIGR